MFARSEDRGKALMWPAGARTSAASWCAVVAVALGNVLGGCDEGKKTQKTNETLEQKENAQMENPASAGSLLEQRLSENVRVADGLLFVKDVDALDLFILPANTPWTIECGFVGFSITFGNSVTGAGGDTENDVKVMLAKGRIDQKNCAILGGRIGKRLQTILGESG